MRLPAARLVLPISNDFDNLRYMVDESEPSSSNASANHADTLANLPEAPFYRSVHLHGIGAVGSLPAIEGRAERLE